MKFSKMLTKVIAGSAMGIMLMSTAAMATNLGYGTATTTTTYTVPGYTYTQSYNSYVAPLVTPSMAAFSDMVTKADLFDGYERMVVERFTKICIPAAEMDAAIAAAEKAADKVASLTVINSNDNKSYNSFPIYFNGGPGAPSGTFWTDATMNKVAYRLAYSSSAREIDELLKKASIGGVELSFDTSFDQATLSEITKPTAPLADKYTGDLFTDMYLTVGHDYLTGSRNMKKWTLVNTVDNGVAVNSGGVTLSKLEDNLDDYAKLLKSLRAFYATSCNVVPNTTTSTTSDTTSKTKDTKSGKNAVITAKDKTIKVGSSFTFKAAGVSATDNNGKGKDLTSKIRTTGKIDTSKPGSFTLTYYVTGANGKQVSTKATYTVK